MSQTSVPTSLTRAYSGMLADSSYSLKVTAVNEEASASIPFGFGVKFGTAEDGVLLPTVQASRIKGIAIHFHGVPDADIDDTGFLPETCFAILRKGRIYVKVEEAVVVGDRGFCRAVATGDEEQGVWRKSADSTDCVDCTKQVVFLSAASAGGVALAEVDFTNEPD
jgi:hypothetical protein